MFKLRIGIRLKLLFFSSFLFAIPLLGYRYVWEMETYLRLGQEQTLLGTARAVATALHERPVLFDRQSAFLSNVKPGTDLYAHKIIDPIRLDGRLDDWLPYRHLALEYDERYLIKPLAENQQVSLSFEHMVGQHEKYLVAMFAVSDDVVILRPENSLRIDQNDHLQISLVDAEGKFRRYIIAAIKEGWVNAYLLRENKFSLKPSRLEKQIQGYWKLSEHGYNLELRFPVKLVPSKIAFAIVDVDEQIKGRKRADSSYAIGTANPTQADSLGTVLIPSPEIEQILKGLKYSNARVWVIDKHRRVLARSGSIYRSTGLRAGRRKVENAWWSGIEQKWLLPLYYKFLTKPPDDFVDELQNAYALEGKDITSALEGKADSLWRISPDNKAVILSAAHPIFIDGRVMGAVVTEQTTHGIRTLRNRALEQLFHVILAILGLGTFALFVFASRMSLRIRKLRNDTEGAIDSNGKIIGNINPSPTLDEIGDLSRSFHNVLTKLTQYNSYLENMSSRLSHELRTPIAIVNSSLENLAMEQNEVERTQYIERAQLGIKRLSKILSNMSEATRLEQAIQQAEREPFVVGEVLSGCVEAYRSAYPDYKFSLSFMSRKSLFGSPELFAQMLDKIIANAIEFSPEQSEIGLNMLERDNTIGISIINTGPLLPENMQEQLLDSMVSVRVTQEADSQPHLGLGLYIAKIIAQYHHAKLEIKNRDDGSGVEVIILFQNL